MILSRRVAHSDVPGALLLDPVILAAIALFLINDHILKAAYPGWVTGKLSDVTGLIYFPVLAAAIAEMILRTRRRREILATAVVLTGITFVGLLIVPEVGTAYRWFFGAAQWPFRAVMETLAGNPLPGVIPVFLAADPTDLITLPALAIPLYRGMRG